MRRSLVVLAVLAVVAFGACSRPAPPVSLPPTAVTPAAPPASLESLAPGQTLSGWNVVARYLDDAGKPKGGRFVHQSTGFQVDYLAIDSAPQAFIWVRSYPTSDMGEPHTQEHLLLGKGKKGRSVANLEEMTRSNSTAFTEQWYTAYSMHTPVAESFWQVLEASLDGLLNPDYTDEEIRGEVRNFGVTARGDGSLVLEEKGTVYNEMVRTYEQPLALVWRAAEQLAYGPSHPLSWAAGGWPESIRDMTAQDIRKFHAEHYHLANMGLIASLPPSIPLADVLAHHGAALDRLAGRRGPVVTAEQLPAPAGAKPGSIRILDFPSASSANPGWVFVVWPATRNLPLKEKVMLDLFVDAMAGDESTELFKLLVDSKTRVLDTGATAIGSFVSPYVGMPVYVQLADVPPRNLTPEHVTEIRAQIVAAVKRVAEAPDGSEAAQAMTRRVRSRLTDLRRTLSKAAGSPPLFGFRGALDFWLPHLTRMEQAGFDRSLTLRPELDAIEAELAGTANPWRRAVKDWRLLLDEPYALAVKPSAELLERTTREREARAAAETQKIVSRMGAKDAAEALAKFRAEAEAQTERVEALATTELPPFTESPPMTMDDALHAKQETVGGVPVVEASFEGMAAAQLGVAFRLDGLPEEDLLYVGLLPALLREVGIAAGTEVIPYDEMTERLRKEILGLEIENEGSVKSGRVELVVTASGNDVEETRRALGWMERVLTAPDWRAENLPRLRDLVARQAAELRKTMRGPEEDWAYGPQNAILMQRSPVYLHAVSFLTAAHDAHRLRWLLEDAGPHREALVRWLGGLEKAGSLGRQKLEKLTAAMQKAGPVAKDAQRYLAAYHALPAAARAIAARAASDLGELLDEIPDESLAKDWTYLCRQIAGDLAKPPAETLAALARVRAQVVRAGNARAWMSSSEATRAAVAGDVAALLGKLDGTAAAERRKYEDRPRIFDRIAERGGGAEPRFVGLLNRSTSSGLVVTSVPGTGYAERGDEKLLRYLAGNLYAGHGSHAVFMKTWGAGLAYSNGLRPSLKDERLGYYAERCPRIPQTLRFVAGVLEQAKPDPRLVDYAVAHAFDSRVADAYESRGEGHARDLADGVSPEMVRGFREKLLELRRRPDVAGAIYERLQKTVGEVLPGYGPASLRGKPGGVYFVAGPEAQLKMFEEQVKQTEGGASLTRIYPRDFWMVR